MRWMKKVRIRNMELPALEKRLTYLQNKYGMRKTNEMRYLSYHIKKREKAIKKEESKKEPEKKRSFIKLVKRHI